MGAFITAIAGLVQAIAVLIVAIFLFKNGDSLLSLLSKMVQALGLLALARRREWDSDLTRVAEKAGLLEAFDIDPPGRTGASHNAGEPPSTSPQNECEENQP